MRSPHDEAHVCARAATRSGFRRFAPALVALALAAPAFAETNLFEWIATAPIVVVARSLGDDGRYHELRVESVVRGDVAPGATLRVDLRHANRSRRRTTDPAALRFDAEPRYLVLLERWRHRDPDAPPFYRIVRGVRGARELPSEGAGALLRAVETFAAIQDARSDPFVWQRLAELLGDPDPLVVRTALEQFVKFRRGTPELLRSLRPLLDHPAPEIRRLTAELAGQVADRHDEDQLSEGEELRAALVGRARRDASGDVRAAATTALGRFSGDAVDRVLREIAEEDPDQHVRYAAEKVLLARRRRAKGSE